MRKYYAYIRVSTQRQGEKGSSLQEQRAAIESFAKRENLNIVEWFEERETAAKQGRTLFQKMFRALKKGRAHGVIMHKIDRGARNLRDWSDLGMLIDKGIEVHFANENLDLSSRGGRLSADIQAVVAADYIRNLREEVLKGLYGRLKQGFYPRQAPLGYLDNGPGQRKTICPERGPLVRTAFELYATGNYSLESLRDTLTDLGLLTRSDRPLTVSNTAVMLHNPFYYGLIHIQKTGETFLGNHEAIVSKALFDRVQTVRRKPIKVKTAKQCSYVLQRMMKCLGCERVLTGETQRKNIYYRCHSRSCHGTSLRENKIVQAVVNFFLIAAIDKPILKLISEMLEIMKTDLQQSVEDLIKSLTFALKKLKDREERLTDAYLDRVIDRETYVARKEALLNEQIEIEEQMRGIQEKSLYDQRAQDFYQLIESLKKLPNMKIPDEIRDLLKRAISNISVSGKCVEITWDFPVRAIFSVPNFLYCGAHKGQCRTFVSHEPGCDCKLPRNNADKIVWSKGRAQSVARAVLMGKEECEREEEKYREM